MRCPVESRDNAALLLDYCARKLDPAAAEILERHIDICPACQEFRAGQQLVWSALDQWETMPVSRDFDRNLYRRIEFETTSPWWARWTPPLPGMPWSPAMPVAAAGLLLFAAVLFQRPAAVVPTDAGRQTRIESVQVDQMERALEDLEMLTEFNLVAAADAKDSGSM